MAHSIVYVRQDMTYLSKQHVCPACKTELNKVQVSKVLRSGSEEDKNMPKMFSTTQIGSRGFKVRRYHYVGNTKYIWTELECPNCSRHFTVEQMKQIEASPEEQWEGLIASFDEAAAQANDSTPETEAAKQTKKGSKKALKLALSIAIPATIVTTLIVTSVIFAFTSLLSIPEFVDTNGPDNFALVEITREDMLKSISNYRSVNSKKTQDGRHTNIVGTKLRDYDYDHINRSFGTLHGILTLQATKVSNDRLTLNINSTVESGNAEIIILIDGEYHCSVAANQNQSITLQDIAGKEVLVKLAGEAAKIQVDVTRTY